MSDWIVPLLSGLGGGLLGSVVGPFISHALQFKARNQETARERNARLRAVVEDAASGSLRMRMSVARGGGGLPWVDFWLAYAPLRAAIPRIPDPQLKQMVKRLYLRLEAMRLPETADALEPESLEQLVTEIRTRMDELNWPEDHLTLALGEKSGANLGTLP